MTRRCPHRGASNRARGAGCGAAASPHRLTNPPGAPGSGRESRKTHDDVSPSGSFMLRFEMFLTSPPQTRASREAIQVWRATAQLVSVRWQTFLDAGAEKRRLAFASYLAALDAEEAAAADVAALAARDREVVHLQFQGIPHAR